MDDLDLSSLLERHFPLAGGIELCETHISRIYLTRDYAFKQKRAIKLPYVDFSTYTKRRIAAESELALNAATAPELYIDLITICRDENGLLNLEERGEAVDVLVRMHRFDENQLFNHIAERGQLDEAILESLAQQLASFHQNAPIVLTMSGAHAVAVAMRANENGFRDNRVFSETEKQKIIQAFRLRLEELAPRLDQRGKEGRLRHCHGDLHLRNICLIGSRPVLFDCIEFNERLASIDVLYDFAFTLMDLLYIGKKKEANLLANFYFDKTDDEEGYGLLGFFMALRAAVRAHVTANLADQYGVKGDEGKQHIHHQEAHHYYQLALSLLEETPPFIVALAGLSGSGKSTLGESLASELGGGIGARFLESDRIRKGLYHLPIHSRLPDEAYQPDVSARVYSILADRAARIAKGQGGAIVGAVYDRQEDRITLEHAARIHHVGFFGFYLDVSDDELRRRVKARKMTSSDAGIDVLEQQLLLRRNDTIRWEKINGNLPFEQVAGMIYDTLKRRL